MLKNHRFYNDSCFLIESHWEPLISTIVQTVMKTNAFVCIHQMCSIKLLKNRRFCMDFWNLFEHIWNSYFSSIINDINKSRRNTDGMDTISIWACHVRAAEPPRYADCSPNRAPLYGVLALNRTGCPWHTPRKVSEVEKTQVL